ncbi:flagellar hook-basal body protein [Paenibacillus spiritus]|uniref:Flagellar hook-basal body protein n=1 Tax=Paenibacillus spiritus TaxID=2496557 RepID=A0A5J5FWL2_9BACL|nr:MULTISPECIES: flagellar hook-basal body protein [Paenibacillus]KAA8998010.1 flagellar hook-basal body protein [Paenibacillus spiritus]
MIRGLYTAAAGLVTQQRRHDTATQNIANLNTTGYKQVDSVSHSFPEAMITAMQGGVRQPIGKLNTGVFAEQAINQYRQGDLIESGKSTDFALAGELEAVDPATGQNIVFDATGKFINDQGEVKYRPQAFFALQDASGRALYTRNGSFAVTAAGEVLSSEGYRVLGADGQPLTLKGDALNVADGGLRVDGQGRILDKTGRPSGAAIGISVVDNPEKLVRDGSGVYHAEDGAGVRQPTTADNIDLRQGYVEGSNVDATQVSVDLNAAYRAYEANQKLIQIYDTSLQKTVNEVGRV